MILWRFLFLEQGMNLFSLFISALFLVKRSDELVQRIGPNRGAYFPGYWSPLLGLRNQSQVYERLLRQTVTAKKFDPR